MKTEIIDNVKNENNKILNKLLILYPFDNDSVTFGYKFDNKEMYELYIQLRDIFKDD